MVAGLALALGCGDPVVSTAYRGEPITTFQVQARVARPPDRALLDGSEQAFAIVVAWGDRGADFDDPDALSEQISTTTRASVSAPFMLNLFDTPPAEARSGGFALGRVLAYVDRDDDGRRGEDEPIIGASEGQGLLWVGAPVTAGASPTGRALTPGVHLVTLPIPTLCGLAPPDRGDGACTVPLGARCAGDADCGTGRCLQTEVMWWPGGACAVESPSDACAAPAGAFLPATGRVAGYRIAPCATDADCARADAPYLCDRGVGGCVPDAGLLLRIGRAPMGSVFCGEPLTDVVVRDEPPAQGTGAAARQ